MGDRAGTRRKREKKSTKEEVRKERTNQGTKGPGKKIYNHGFDEFNKMG